MSFTCDVYTSPTTVWPRQQFPRTLFPRWSGQRLTAARNAWTYFEQIEFTDAAIRVAASGSGQPAVIWTPFDKEGARIQYNYGKFLHQQLCPDVNWTSQRDLGISPTPLTDIWPTTVCPPINTILSGVCPAKSF
jgi:hypothetical protein